MEAQKALDKAKIKLMSKPDSAFFTTICFSLKHVWSDSIPTAATNGKVIKFNPEFFMDLDSEEQVFLLLHETLHVAYLHMDRLQLKKPRLWNIAADHVINLQLIERGYKMPEKGFADPRFKGMNTERVYKILEEEKYENPDDSFLDLEEPEIPSDELQREIEDILVQASIQSKLAGDSPGTIPGDIQIFIDNLLNPKLPWYTLLKKFFNGFSKNDYSWKKPNRRYFPKNILPSLYSQSLGSAAVFADTSGSVTDSQFLRVISETFGMLKKLKPEKIYFGQFDSFIKSVDVVKTSKDLMNVKFTGRGGTYIYPVMEWAKENKPKVLLVFTDGHFRKNNLEDPGIPVIWLIYDNTVFNPPFGKVIFFEE